MIPALSVETAITIVTGIVTLAGVVFTQRAGLADLKSKYDTGQAEVLRQLGALHKRMDAYGARISRGEINHAVLLERVDNLRTTQRMRTARLEAAAEGQPPMFSEDDQG